MIDPGILKVELLREISTLIMLLAVGYLAGTKFMDRLAYFLLAFAVWDIFYYGWLKVFINWPASLMEWDILFLIPFTWLGPVLAPIICSFTMIVLALVLLVTAKPLSRLAWTLISAGCVFILYTFMQDYGWLIINNGLIGDYPNILQNQDFLRLASGYIPAAYNWSLFLLGEIFLLAGIYCQYQRLGTGTDSNKQVSRLNIRWLRFTKDT
jgi:hypothetical protein